MCSLGPGWSDVGGDCDDSEPDVHWNSRIAAADDAIAQDCDGTTDDDDASDASTWYVDTDGDGTPDILDCDEYSANLSENDNDGDGYTAAADIGCETAFDLDEYVYQCEATLGEEISQISYI